jgi:TonB family protein
MSGIEGLLAGRVLAERYYIERVIGRGGMGAVYAAQDQRLGRPVAVKVMILPAGDPEARERVRLRFHREAQAAARLRHPNVVTVHDFGTDEALGLDYLVMELLEGEDLAARMARTGPPPASETLSILRQAARGLAAGHRAGMVHRDVKPGNLFLERGEHGDTEVRILDFGIAQVAFDDLTLTHLTAAGRGPLSPAYASPEQLAGERRLTPASDVFSLGAVALYLLTGERPFGTGDGRAGEEIAAALARLDGRADVPPAFRAVLARALAADPAARFPDAGSFREALDAVALGDEERARDLAEREDIAPEAPFAAAGAAWPGVAAPEHDERTELADLAPAPRTEGVDPVTASATHPPAAAPAPVRRGGKQWLLPLGVAVVLAGGAAAVALRQSGQAGQATPPLVDTARVDSGAAATDTASATTTRLADSVRRDSLMRARNAKLAADSTRLDSLMRAESERSALAQAESIRIANTQPSDGVWAPTQLDQAPQLSNRDEVERQLSRRFPARLQSAGVSGSVNLQLVVDERGRVDKGSIAVLSATNPDFADPSIEVARRMRFSPGMKNGRPVKTRVQVPINWQATQ